MQTYQGPDTYGLDIDGLRALIKAGAMDQTVVIPQVQPKRPVLFKGKRRKSSDAKFWTMLTVGLSLVFVAVVWFATVGVYSWLRAHGA